MTRVKICGIKDAFDAQNAVLLGADAIGLNFVETSPRCIEPTRATRIIESLPAFVSVVGVFVNHPDPQHLEDFAVSIGLHAVQLHGNETPDYCSMIHRVKVIKAFRVKDQSSLASMRDYEVSAFLLDSSVPGQLGGTGARFNWDLAVQAKSFGTPIILAGGLTPENIADAVAKVAPWAVDVSSGVETSPGVKDHTKVREFIRRAKGLN